MEIEQDEIIIMVQFEKDRNLCPFSERCFAIKDKEVYYKVCSRNYKSCRNFLEGSVVSEKQYMNRNYVIEARINGAVFVLSGGEQIWK